MMNGQDQPNEINEHDCSTQKGSMTFSLVYKQKGMVRKKENNSRERIKLEFEKNNRKKSLS